MFDLDLDFGLGDRVDELRQAVREFARRRIAPRAAEIDRSNQFPRDLWPELGGMGLLGITVEEEFGGLGYGYLEHVVAMEEISRASASVGLSYGAHSNLCVNQIRRWGTPQQKRRHLPALVSGEHVGALAMSEAEAGSDVVGMRLRAEPRDGGFVLNGRKMWITNGPEADTLVVYGSLEPGTGAAALTAFIVEKGTPGLSAARKLDKLGMRGSDTCELVFEDCLVPVGNLLGEEGQGFYGIMANFQMERLQLALLANMTSELALEESLKYVKQREAFGRTLEGFQVTRHKLVDMATLLEASREFTYRVAAKIEAGLNPVKEISMANNFACQTSDKVTYDAVQLHGGYGYMREYLVERLYRDNRILSIGGGTQEIMKEIIGKLMF